MMKGADKPKTLQQVEHAHASPTPLEMVREHQARMQNRGVVDHHFDISTEVPGHSIPSSRRKHPQRQMG